jgi:hypothetical protein
MKMTGLAIAMAFAATACAKGESSEANPPALQTSSETAASPASSAPAAGQGASASLASASAVPIKVYKDPNCGCCKKWIDHLEQNGFKVEVMDLPDLSAVKSKHGVKQELQACHTGVVGNYTVEGHVPADLIHKMLKEKPSIAGLAVPGMPMGSPGMEGAIKEKYDVLTFDRAGRTTVYAQR